MIDHHNYDIHFAHLSRSLYSIFPPSSNQVGKFETVLNVGIQFAHLFLLVGKFDTVLKVGIQFAHLFLLVGKFETILKVGIQFAHH